MSTWPSDHTCHWQIRRYEGCLLSALDSRGNRLQAITPIAKRHCGEPNHSHAHAPSAKLAPAEVLRGGSTKSSRVCSSDASGGEVSSASGDEGEPSRPPSSSNFFSEQAKLLSDLFSHPWKLADCPDKEDGSCYRHQTGPKHADWR